MALGEPARPGAVVGRVVLGQRTDEVFIAEAEATVAVAVERGERIAQGLFVKVDKNWQRKPQALERLGY